jgi:hypothetical protein
MIWWLRLIRLLPNKLLFGDKSVESLMLVVSAAWLRRSSEDFIWFVDSASLKLNPPIFFLEVLEFVVLAVSGRILLILYGLLSSCLGDYEASSFVHEFIFFIEGSSKLERVKIDPLRFEECLAPLDRVISVFRLRWDRKRSFESLKISGSSYINSKGYELLLITMTVDFCVLDSYII